MGSECFTGIPHRRLQYGLTSVLLNRSIANKGIDGWNRDATPMTRGEYGVWEVTLPAKDGQLGIPHNSKVKVRFEA